LPATDGQKQDSLAVTLSEISERMAALVRDEIALASAEMEQKAKSLLRGGIAIGAGAVFGLFALIYGLLAAAWGINDAVGNEWVGFLIVFGALLVLALSTFLFAWRKLKVGAPKPTMAIDEAKRIRQTVVAKPGEMP
jgi:uncharacterized membrane protein YqjE